jgi:hypothetical protein
MKKSILALSLTAALFACKKDKTNSFTQTDVTGTSIVKGTVNKNVITPNGFGSWTNNSRIPAAGVAVSVKINKNSLYPNSNAQGADVYSGTTDKDGNYSISVKSNANGVQALITIDGFTGTMDSIANGVTKTGLYSSYSGNSQNRTVFMGQNVQFDHNFFGNAITTNPNTLYKIGSATVTGSVAVNYVKEVLTGTFVTFTSTNVPVAGRTVYLNFSNDPTTLATKLYTVTTDASGFYSFDIATVPANTSGLTNQNAVVWVADYAATRDTIKANGSLKTGRAGVYSQQTINQFGIYNNNIRNANNFLYNGFTAN